MNLYLVTYDLRQPGRNYTALYQAIRACGRAIRPLESIWILTTNLTAVQVRDSLTVHVDRNDGLLVIQCGAPAAWQGISMPESATLKSAVEAFA